eukprot:TRINITY_DN3615_c0_g1_i1.p1 TRINITY_DN3615_c0_g1~~TRINITY_DN3615_c0_g1_i1.p1  ORF type:complete len:378 (-),score=50.82 TRINITY_DN3615_c0_g1_i1:118-1176(-)
MAANCISINASRVSAPPPLAGRNALVLSPHCGQKHGVHGLQGGMTREKGKLHLISNRRRTGTLLRLCIVSAQGNDTETKKSSSGAATSVLRFLCPLLKFFGGGDAAAPRSRFVEVATSGIASMARLPWGSQVRLEIVQGRDTPTELFQLYEFEACPFCRRVREALTELDLPTQVYPCPKDSTRHRPMVKQLGGKEQFPYFVDPNTGAAMYESGDIVKYLFRTYGNGAEPTLGLLQSTLLTGVIPTLVRAGRGMIRYSGAVQDPPKELLQLYSYENNQFARLAREALCELELPYVLCNAGKGSANAAALRQLAGSTQVPLLVDPNTGRTVRDSEQIVEYLFDTYGRKVSALAA